MCPGWVNIRLQLDRKLTLKEKGPCTKEEGGKGRFLKANAILISSQLQPNPSSQLQPNPLVCSTKTDLSGEDTSGSSSVGVTEWGPCWDTGLGCWMRNWGLTSSSKKAKDSAWDLRHRLRFAPMYQGAGQILNHERLPQKGTRPWLVWHKPVLFPATKTCPHPCSKERGAQGCACKSRAWYKQRHFWTMSPSLWLQHTAPFCTFVFQVESAAFHQHRSISALLCSARQHGKMRVMVKLTADLTHSHHHAL